MNLDHPGINEFGYHHRCMYYNQDEDALKATGESIRKTVPKSHPELPLLRKAYLLRQREIRQAKANKELQEAIDNDD